MRLRRWVAASEALMLEPVLTKKRAMKVACFLNSVNKNWWFDVYRLPRNGDWVVRNHRVIVKGWGE